jgi:hypothetical protein
MGAENTFPRCENGRLTQTRVAFSRMFWAEKKTPDAVAEVSAKKKEEEEARFRA